MCIIVFSSFFAKIVLFLMTKLYAPKLINNALMNGKHLAEVTVLCTNQSYMKKQQLLISRIF